MNMDIRFLHSVTEAQDKEEGFVRIRMLMWPFGLRLSGALVRNQPGILKAFKTWRPFGSFQQSGE